METLLASMWMLLDPYVIVVILASSALGLFVGAVPGLTAAMAIALLVPVTFFMPPLPALAAMVTTSAMAIFAGDIPGALLRIPGTPAGAAYTDEAYALTRKGQGEVALGAGLVFSAIGGIFGTLVLIVTGPMLAEISLNFSSFEYFWLVCLGLTCAVFVARGSLAKSLISLVIGLLVACIGMENPAAYPRFTFGTTELIAAIDFISAMIGLFAVSEILRSMSRPDDAQPPVQIPSGSIFAGQLKLAMEYPKQWIRGCTIGSLIGALPGAGCDIAAWVTYATSKRFSKEPEKFGTGHVEGIIESGAANNAAVSGSWIPALVFGIPGDTITAIVIGVLYLKGLIPGPMIFQENAEMITALLMVFILANLLMLPFGWIAIKMSVQILSVSRTIILPIVLIVCIIGAFAVTNSVFAVVLILAFGILGFTLEEHDFPVAPIILGIVLGPLLEQNFFSSMLKADGSILAFFSRPIGGSIGVATVLLWSVMAWYYWRNRNAAETATAAN